MRIASVIFDNKEVQVRVRTFIDCFHYVNNSKGRITDLYHDSHLSIIEEIAYRLTKSGLHISTINFIGLQLENPLLNTKDDRISRKGDYVKLVNSIKSKYLSKEYPVALLSCKEFIRKINGDNNDGYFKRIVTLIGEIIVDKDNPYYQKDFHYYCKILISEFRRKGFRKKDLDGLSGVFNRILNSDYEIAEGFENKIYTKVPLPRSITKLKGTSEYVENAIDYIENRTFADQLLELYHIYDTMLEKKFIIPISDVIISSSKITDFKVQRVRFTTQDRIVIDAEDEDAKRLFFDKFDAKRTLYAEVLISYCSFSHGVEQAHEIVQEEFAALNLFFGSGGKILRDKTVAHGGGVWFSFNMKDLHIRSYSKTFVKFAEQDSLLSRADFESFKLFKYYNNKDVIVSAWKTIEVAMKLVEGNYGLSSDKCIRKYMDSIFDSEVYRIDSDYHNCIINIVYNSDEIVLNRKLNGPALNQFIDGNRDEGLDEIYKLVSHPFVTWLYDQKNDLSHTSIRVDRFYYKLILLELFEQRNMIIHDNDPVYPVIRRLSPVIKEVIKWWKLYEIKKRRT
jgi:hypothetical protein